MPVAAKRKNMIKRNRTAYSLGFSEGIKVDMSIGALFLRFQINEFSLRKSFRKGYRDGLKERKAILGTWSNSMLGGLRRNCLRGLKLLSELLATM